MRATGSGLLGATSNGVAMPAFDPELTQVMRDVLEDVMTRVPVGYSTWWTVEGLGSGYLV